METMELAQRAMAELAPLGDGLGLRAAMQAAETDALAPHMLSALLGHELVAGHATMMKLSTKIDRWLALVADDRAPADQERGSREAVRLAVAAARLSERYRVGLLSLAKLRGWEGFRKGSVPASAGHRVEPGDLLAGIADNDGPDDGPNGGPGGGSRALAAALKQLQAMRRDYGAVFDNGHGNGTAKPNGAPKPNGPHTPPPAAPANRGKLRHGNPSGDFLAAPRCGAKTRAGCPCRQPAMGNGRCRLHGGKSTGARTESGLARVRTNRLVHGARTAEIIDLRSAAARHGRTLRALARLAKATAKPQSERSTPCPASHQRVSPRNHKEHEGSRRAARAVATNSAPSCSSWLRGANDLPHRSDVDFERPTPPACRSRAAGRCPARPRRAAAG